MALTNDKPKSADDKEYSEGEKPKVEQKSNQIVRKFTNFVNPPRPMLVHAIPESGFGNMVVMPNDIFLAIASLLSVQQQWRLSVVSAAFRRFMRQHFTNIQNFVEQRRSRHQARQAIMDANAPVPLPDASHGQSCEGCINCDQKDAEAIAKCCCCCGVVGFLAFLIFGSPCGI